MKTIDIKGKEYVMVNERILHFWNNYEGSIETELLSNEDGICIFKATIYNQDHKILATGHAYEKEGSTFINKTSYIENCETSAVGRALGLLGIGIETSIASAEEVGNAVAQQDDEAGKKYKEKTKNLDDKNNKNATYWIADMDKNCATVAELAAWWTENNKSIVKLKKAEFNKLVAKKDEYKAMFSEMESSKMEDDVPHF